MLEQAKKLHYRISPARRSKGEMEMRYWRKRQRVEGTLGHDHYAWLYTGEFGLTLNDYVGKRVLDIGCGPRGSLEWADGATERVGLDPLVEDYRALGIDQHAMNYVASGAENIPFPDGHFDLVATFNSLDHVDDVDATIREITRVTRRGGIGLVIVEVNHPATPTEPHTLPWELFDRFAGWTIETEKRTAIHPDHDVYQSYRVGTPWTDGPGILGGLLRHSPCTAS